MGGWRRLDPSPEVSRIAGGRRQAEEAGGGWSWPSRVARQDAAASPGGAHRSGAGLDLLVPRSCPTTPARSRSGGALAHDSAAGSHGGLDWRSLPSTCRWWLRREDEAGKALVLAAVASWCSRRCPPACWIRRSACPLAQGEFASPRSRRRGCAGGRCLLDLSLGGARKPAVFESVAGTWSVSGGGATGQ